MDLNELVEIVKTLYDGKVTDEEVMVYLKVAERKILDRLYPYGQEDTIPNKYEVDLCELACRLIARKGAEGEVSHSENGVSRTYASASDEDILSRITPFGKVIS